MKNKQGFASMMALIVIVAVVVIAGGAYVLTRQEAEAPTAAEVVKVPPSQPTTNTNLDAPRPSDTVAVSTAGWQTYKNEKYGFEVGYPNEWKVEAKETPLYSATGELINSASYSFSAPLRSGQLEFIGMTVEVYNSETYTKAKDSIPKRSWWRSSGDSHFLISGSMMPNDTQDSQIIQKFLGSFKAV